MDAISFLRALRRNWYIVLAAIVVAVLTSLLVWRPGAPAVGRYQATATLVRSSSAPKTFTMSSTALYLNQGDVPKRAAAALNYAGDPNALAAKLTVSSNDKVGTITIVENGKNAVVVTRTVNAFADSLIAFLRDSNTTQAQQLAAAAQVQLNSISKRLNELDAAIAARRPPPSALVAERSALLSRYQVVSKSLDDQVLAATQPPPVFALEATEAKTVGSAGIPLLGNTDGRALIAAIIGLLVGLAIVYALARFDARIRDLDSVERAYGLPVLAEVPRLPRSRRVP